nr:MAG TPA: hypothetical protein [Caudoviricetes sp.]
MPHPCETLNWIECSLDCGSQPTHPRNHNKSVTPHATPMRNAQLD